jgi:hypothetical protein
LFEPPSAQASTIRDRCANACDDLDLLDQRANLARSSSVSTNSALGLPVRAIAQV